MVWIVSHMKFLCVEQILDEEEFSKTENQLGETLQRKYHEKNEKDKKLL